MPQIPLIISGHVYTHATTNAIENVVVHVKNLETQERHDGKDSNFGDLKTNSNGEFSCNLANFTEDYTIGDVIQFTINHNGKMDLILYTLGGSVNSIILTPMDREIYDYERSLDEIGSKIIIYTESSTLDADYGSIATDTTTRHANYDDNYASIQLDADEQSLEDQGVVSHGVANGFFKIRYNISKNDKVEAPAGSGNYWRVADRPKRLTFKNEYHHDEAKLVRV